MISDLYKEIASAYTGEVFTMPSMTEDSHILTLAQLVKDYSRGIVHNECYRQAYYDEGDDMDPVRSYEDITDVFDVHATYQVADTHSQMETSDKEAPANNKGSEQAEVSAGADAEAGV